MPSKRNTPRTCEQCGKEFLALAHEVAKGWARFCSQRCKGVSQAGVERAPLVERFWGMVDKNPGHGPWGDCWIWTGAKTKSGKQDEEGYGKLTDKHKSLEAHRVGYEIQIGPIPVGLHVLHKCDFPPCVRGSHLFTGTNMDNIMDRAFKNRHWRVASPEKIKEIRDDLLTGISQQAIADKYGVSQTMVSRIKLGLSRKQG